MLLIGVVVAHWLSGRLAAFRASLAPAVGRRVGGSGTIALPLLWTWLFAEATTRPVVDLVEAGRGSLHPASLLTAFVADLFGAHDPGSISGGPTARTGTPRSCSCRRTWDRSISARCRRCC